MSLPKYRFVGTEPASFACVCHSPSGVERRFDLGDKYQKSVDLLFFLFNECGLAFSDSCLAVSWTDDAKVGDSISFPGCCVTAIG